MNHKSEFVKRDLKQLVVVCPDSVLTNGFIRALRHVTVPHVCSALAQSVTAPTAASCRDIGQSRINAI